MHWMPHTCNKNLCTKFIIFKDLMHFSDKVHSILSIIIKSPNKWTHILCTSFCCQYCLIYRKTKRNIYWNIFGCQYLTSLETLRCQRTFDNHVVAIFSKSSAFL